MPRTRRKPLGARAEPIIRKVVGGGRRGRVLDQALARLPLNLRPAVDVTGWTSTEFLAHLEQSPGAPPARRTGSRTVRRINAMAGTLPVEAVLLARAITDTAPPAGQPVPPTLRSILENYLPESLRAYAGTRSRGPNPAAEELLLAQLRLLHQVALDVHRGDADQDSIDLRIQDAFLRERFAQLSPGALSLEDSPPAQPIRAPAGAEERRPGVAAGRVNANAGVDVDPVVLFAAGHPPGKLTFRLAIPKGHPTTLGAVLQTHGGAVEFRHTESRRWRAQRRSTGFPTAQTDLALTIDLAGIRRLLVFAHSPARSDPTRCVLFVRDAAHAQTAMSTLLAGRWGAQVTVVCSGYAGPDGMVVRNESRLYPDLRTACTGFGYDSITWLDADTPIV
jgi:hypothetical protein